MNKKNEYLLTGTALAAVVVWWRISRANKTATTPKPTTTWYRTRKGNS